MAESLLRRVLFFSLWEKMLVEILIMQSTSIQDRVQMGDIQTKRELHFSRFECAGYFQYLKEVVHDTPYLFRTHGS